MVLGLEKKKPVKLNEESLVLAGADYFAKDAPTGCWSIPNLYLEARKPTGKRMESDASCGKKNGVEECVDMFGKAYQGNPLK